MERSDALSAMAGHLRAVPGLPSSRPDLVVVDQETGDVSQVYGGNVDRLDAALKAAGLLVTRPT
jgi:hypothetical protein